MYPGVGTFVLIRPAQTFCERIKLAWDLDGPDPRWSIIPTESWFMGQDLLNPPSVEGWHTGKEWITRGALMRRVNFVADYVRKTELSGIQEIIERITTQGASNGNTISAEALVDSCLDLMGPVQVAPNTHRSLVSEAAGDGPLTWGTDEEHADFSRRVGDTMALIAGTREYQFG